MEGSNQTRWPPSSTYAIEQSMRAAVELNGAELFGCSELYTVLTQVSTNFLKDNFSETLPLYTFSIQYLERIELNKKIIVI